MNNEAEAARREAVEAAKREVEHYPDCHKLEAVEIGFTAGLAYANRWAPVSERPKEEGYYEVSTTAPAEEPHLLSQGIRVPYVSQDFYSADDECFDDPYVYAWRELREPAPYQPEKEATARANSQPQPDAVAEAVEAADFYSNDPHFKGLYPRLAAAIRVLIDHAGGGWVEIRSCDDLPQTGEGEPYIFRERGDGEMYTVTYWYSEMLDRGPHIADSYSHYQRITPPTETK